MFKHEFLQIRSCGTIDKKTKQKSEFYYIPFNSWKSTIISAFYLESEQFYFICWLCWLTYWQTVQSEAISEKAVCSDILNQTEITIENLNLTFLHWYNRVGAVDNFSFLILTRSTTIIYDTTTGVNRLINRKWYIKTKVLP